MKKYKSVTSQTLHYLSRPHQRICKEPIILPSAWKGKDLRKEQSWKETLSAADIEEIEKALVGIKKLGKNFADYTKEDFQIPRLAKKIEGWRKEILNGYGLKVIKGVPVYKWTVADSEIFFWILGLYLGTPGVQDNDGQFLGHVKDTSKVGVANQQRLYKTAKQIKYHCDAADVVGLLCINKAKEGGESLLASSITIYNEILRLRPDLIDLLYKPLYLDTFNSGGTNSIQVPPCRFFNGKLKTFYHSDYFRSVRQYSNVPAFTKAEEELLNLYDEIALDPNIYLDMDLEPGDIQLISNHTTIHARTDYIDFEEEHKKRHLLRLWLSLEEPENITEQFYTWTSKLSLLTNIIMSRLRFKFSDVSKKN